MLSAVIHKFLRLLFAEPIYLESVSLLSFSISLSLSLLYFSLLLVVLISVNRRFSYTSYLVRSGEQHFVGVREMRERGKKSGKVERGRGRER